jgi:hypothetical protein
VNALGAALLTISISEAGVAVQRIFFCLVDGRPWSDNQTISERVRMRARPRGQPLEERGPMRRGQSQGSD